MAGVHVHDQDIVQIPRVTRPTTMSGREPDRTTERERERRADRRHRRRTSPTIMTPSGRDSDRQAVALSTGGTPRRPIKTMH
jgi:hypothetical protein